MIMKVSHYACLQIANQDVFSVWYDLIPAFSVMCIANIFRNLSFDKLSKQDGSKSTNHSPLTWPFELVAHLHRSDMKQTSVCIGCDWLISNSKSKDDVER